MEWGEKDSKDKWHFPKLPARLLFFMSIIVLILSVIASFNPVEFDPIFLIFGILSLIISSYLLWFQKEEDSEEKRTKKSFLGKLFKKKKTVYEIPKI